MAKLNRPGSPSAVSGPAVGQAENLIPFTSSPVATAKKPRVKGEAKERVLLTRGKAWFDLHFAVGDAEKVFNRRFYQIRGGFRCAACNIPGTVSFIIESKDGTGVDLDAMAHDGKTAIVVKGYEVGYNCLKKYGGVDAAKIVRNAA